MSFLFQPQYFKRVPYSPGSTEVVRLPAGNLISAIRARLNAEVNVTATASLPPFNQVARLCKTIRLNQVGGKTIWSLSGEMAAEIFSNRRGVAGDNTTIAGTVANDLIGVHHLDMRAAPDDAMKPWDYAIDTRKYDYDLEFVFNDLTVLGNLFGAGTITATAAESYIDLELEMLTLTLGPDGKPDSLEKVSPFLRGLTETNVNVDNDNPKLAIRLPDFQEYRNIIIKTTETASNQELGRNTVLNDEVMLRTTDNKVIQKVKANALRSRTKQFLGVETLADGLYWLPLTAFGAIGDHVKSDRAAVLELEQSVKKLTGATRVRLVYDTKIAQ